MHFHATFACTALVAASAVIAHEIASPEWDKYAEEREQNSHLAAREAWEAAHGGKAPVYDAFEENHGFHFARSLPHFDEAEVDTSLEGYDHEAARHFARSVPHFDGAEVDTSLKGYDHEAANEYAKHTGHFARSLPHFDEVVVDTSLEGYDHAAANEYAKHAGHFARSVHEPEVDYSLEGYDHSLLNEAERHDLHARSTNTWLPKDWKEEAWSKHLSYYSEELTAASTATGTADSWIHPTNVARGLKDTWKMLKGALPDDFDEGVKKHPARAVPAAHNKPAHGEADEHMHFAREAGNVWPSHEGFEHAHPSHTTEHLAHFPTHVARGENDVLDRERAKLTHSLDNLGKKVTKEYEGRVSARSMPYEYDVHHAPEPMLHRPHQARDVEAAEPTAADITEGLWAKHSTSTKKAAESIKTKTGGWGFSW